MHKLNADTGISARRREHVRTTGAGQEARLQQAAGRGVEARARPSNRNRSRAPFLESQERAEQSGGVNPVALRKESAMT